MADNTVYNSPMWTAGDGYGDVDYLSNLQGYNDDSQQKDNYYGGKDSFNMLDYAASQSPSMYYNSGTNTLGNLSSTLGSTGSSWGNAASTLIGDYNNASTDSGSSTLSGAASGAIAGFQVAGPWGAVAGGIIGGLAGLFGSKSKKKQANQQFQQNLQLQVAPEQQKQANYLQQQSLQKAAIAPYSSAYTPGGYQYKNKLFGGNTGGIPEPQNGSLDIPSAPPSATSPGLGKPLQFNVPNAAFKPAPTPVAPTAPSYSSNAATNATNTAAYGKAYQDYITQQNQLAAAQAMNPYAAFLNKGS